MATFRFDHVHLVAQDIDATARWYCEMLGGVIRFEGQFRGSKVKYVECGGARLIVYGALEDELPLPAALHPRYGVDHFGFQVDDLDGAVGELRAKGVRIVEEPWTVRPGVRIAFIEAPDRVRIELAERKG